MHHLLEHINQDITRRLSKDKDSTVNKIEYRSKRNPTGKPLWARQTRLKNGHLKIDKTIVLIENDSLMEVGSIAECSPWSILQYF